MKIDLRYGIAAAVTAALAGGLLLLVMPASPQAAANAPRAVMAVTLTTAVAQPWPMALPSSGPLVAWQEGSIGAETGGLRITALHADVGSQVHKGELLAELAQEGVAADLRKAEAAVATARAGLAQARANATRARAVRESGILSAQQYDDYMIAEQTAQANLDAAQAQLDAQRVTLAHTRITAVDDGLITSRSATLGTVVGAGEELFRLMRRNRVEWRAEVDALQLAQVRPGQTARLTLADGREIEGKVRLVAPTLSLDTSRAYVYVALPPARDVRPGLYASGRIETGVREALTVPHSALVLRDGRGYLFEVGADGRVARRAVETGRSHGDRIEITAGIGAQARLVASGAAFLNDGDPVSVVSAAQEQQP
jgi:RND family efflux transporter MFP subunit